MCITILVIHIYFNFVFNKVIIIDELEVFLMAKKEFKSEVIEHIADLKEYQNKTKSVLRMIWGDNPVTMDIRIVDKNNNFVGKGISLSEKCVFKLFMLFFSFH